MKLAALGLSLILFALPFAPRADENLVAKREMCRQEAKARVAPRAKMGIEEYRRIVDRRKVHVDECMTRVVVAQRDLPLPPRRAVEGAAQGRQDLLIVTVRKKPERAARRAERRQLKTASIKPLKGKRLKRSRRGHK